MGHLIRQDLEKLLTGDYSYQHCTSRWFVGLRRRWLPWTLRYETRYVPPFVGSIMTTFPLYERIPHQPAQSAAMKEPPHDDAE